MTMHRIAKKCAVIALLVMGSATLLFSCKQEPPATVYDFETLMTESSENRTISMIEDGRCAYTFYAPLIEGYSMATNPYQEFRRGIRLVTYRQDTIKAIADTTFIANLVDATITANYAIYYEKQQLWEAKGDVVVIKQEREDGDTIVTGTTEVYTQQLYWNATIGKIYSNVDTHVVTADGPQFGEGFDTDEELKEIHFRKYIGEVAFDFKPANRDKADSLSHDETAPRAEQGSANSQPAVKPNTRPTAPATRPNQLPRPEPGVVASQRIDAPIADLKSSSENLGAELNSNL